MKNDTTTTLLNFVLAVLVILSVVFAWMSTSRNSELRQIQARAQAAQMNFLRAQQLANDVAAYNATAKSPELAQILASIQAPQPAAK